MRRMFPHCTAQIHYKWSRIIINKNNEENTMQWCFLLKCHRILLTVIVPTVETKCQHNKSSPRIKRGRGPSDENVAPPRRGAAERPADKSDLCSVLLLMKTILQNMGHQNKFYGPAPCRCIAKIHCIHLSFFPVDLKSIFRINARWNCKCWDVMWAEIVPVTAGSKSDRYSFIAAACLFEQSVNIKVTRRIDCTK